MSSEQERLVSSNTTAQARDTVYIASVQERLRQERETFNQKQRQDGRWFTLRLVMGWTAIVLLPIIGFVAGWVIVNHADFSDGTVALAASALLVDSLGLVMSVWRIVLGSGPEQLSPITTDRANLKP